MRLVAGKTDVFAAGCNRLHSLEADTVRKNYLLALKQELRLTIVLLTSLWPQRPATAADKRSSECPCPP